MRSLTSAQLRRSVRGDLAGLVAYPAWSGADIGSLAIEDMLDCLREGVDQENRRVDMNQLSGTCPLLRGFFSRGLYRFFVGEDALETRFARSVKQY